MAATTAAAGVSILFLGVGAGATCVYSREPSSSFVLLRGGTEPLLLCDVGLGVTAACLNLLGSMPAAMYVSHNHTDHSGELPVVVAAEGTAAAGAGRPLPAVYAHPIVMAELRTHRLRELESTGACAG
jgi:ribonuclease BN (tRNA processing enzyme)